MLSAVRLCNLLYFVPRLYPAPFKQLSSVLQATLEEMIKSPESIIDFRQITNGKKFE